MTGKVRLDESVPYAFRSLKNWRNRLTKIKVFEDDKFRLNQLFDKRTGYLATEPVACVCWLQTGVHVEQCPSTLIMSQSLELHQWNTKLDIWFMKSKACRRKLWKTTVMCIVTASRMATNLCWRVALLTEVLLVWFSEAQEWLSVIWLTVRHRRGSELFVNDLTGSSSRAPSLLGSDLCFNRLFGFSVSEGVKYRIPVFTWFTSPERNIWQRSVQLHYRKCLCLWVHWDWLERAALGNTNWRSAGADSMWQLLQVWDTAATHT